LKKNEFVAPETLEAFIVRKTTPRAILKRVNNNGQKSVADIKLMKLGYLNDILNNMAAQKSDKLHK
jgi:hypothetical protein